MNKPTNGPWAREGLVVVRDCKTRPLRYLVLSCSTTAAISKEEMIANADMAAAAWHLRWACEAALKAMEHLGGGPRPHGAEEEWDEIVNALKRAKGETVDEEGE